MRVEPELPDHPKYQRLKRRVGDFALEALVRLWGHCQQNQRGGVWRGVDAEYVELIAKWDGEPGLLFRSLSETGWVHESEGSVVIHDWDEMNMQIVKNWTNGTKGGRPKKHGVPEGKNHLETQRLTQTKTSLPLGLPGISGGDLKNPVVNPNSVSVNPSETHCKPAQHNITKLNETVLPEESRVPSPESPVRHDLAFEVIRYLNELTGAEFKGTSSELHLVASCLASVGNDFEAVKKMVARQVALWLPQPKTAAWLQPRTLFDPEKFDGYFAMRELPTDNAVDPVQRRRELEEQIAKHRANKQSVYYRPDATEADREDLKKLRGELAALQQKVAAGSGV